MNRERKARPSLEGTHQMSHHGPSAVTRLKGNKLLRRPPAQCLSPRGSSLPLSPCSPGLYSQKEWCPLFKGSLRVLPIYAASESPSSLQKPKVTEKNIRASFLFLFEGWFRKLTIPQLPRVSAEAQQWWWGWQSVFGVILLHLTESVS